MNKFRLSILFISFAVFLSTAQSNNEYLQLSTGYNRIGFYNDLAFKFEIKQHQISFGLRHYTLDNFFEKNTIGMSLGYNYIIHAQNEKFYFYPGISTGFFKENKSYAQVYLTDLKLINGVGYNISKHWSINYQLGLGVLKTKSYLVNVGEVSKIDYFNYEISVGLTYRFGNSAK